MNILKKQSGFLLLSAVILIIAIAFIAATAAYVFVVNSRSSADQQLTTKALYVAEAGMQVALTRVVGTDVSQRIQCSQVTGHVDLTDVSFGPGQFTVIATAVTPYTTLSATINASTTIIPVASITGFETVGSVMIDREVVNYTGTSTSAGSCGGIAPCLTGATRGAVTTTATAHVSGTPVGQDMCILQSTGKVPSNASPLATRIIKRSVSGVSKAVQAVGQKLVAPASVNHKSWNGVSWDSVSSGITVANFNDITILSFVDGWLVGDSDPASCSGSSKDTVFARWNGTVWTQVCSQDVSAHLYAIYCVSFQDCWAAGQSGTFAHYNGTWSQFTNVTPISGSVSGWTINDIYCSASNDCWAVGNKVGGKSLFVYYNGTSWTQINPAASVQDEALYSITCLSSTDCWSIGNKGTFAHWNGSSWVGTGFGVSGVPASVAMRGLSCAASNDCWAVGSRNLGIPMFVHFDGSNWTRDTVNVNANVQDKDMHDIFCIGANECWAVGDLAANYWNGTEWSDISTGIPNRPMEAVSGAGPPKPQIIGWKEIYN